MVTFGTLFRTIREHSKQTLRAFCVEHSFDPGNVSRLERGRIAPPESDEVLAKYAYALGVIEGSDEWSQFFDLAAAERGRIPSDLMEDEELVQKLPLLFRTIRGANPQERESLRELAENIRRL